MIAMVQSNHVPKVLTALRTHLTASCIKYGVCAALWFKAVTCHCALCEECSEESAGGAGRWLSCCRRPVYSRPSPAEVIVDCRVSR